MATKVVNQIMQQKRGTLANWTSKNPVLKAGEIAVVILENNKKMFKVGDGTTAFTSLPYIQINLADVVGLLDANGKFSTDLLPSLALGDTEVVANDEARFALTTANVQKGDVVIVTGTNKTYFVVDDTKLNIEDGYAQILVPAAPVQSVNGKTGNVTLDTDDVSEGSNNQYYTDARATLAAATYVTSTLLPDGATILHTNDEITIDAGEVTAPAGE